MELSDYCREQYNYITGSRQVLFNYCKIMTPDHFLAQEISFGRGGSIRNLLVHIATTYEFWIANQALKKNITYTAYDSKRTIAEVIELFKTIDLFMEEFIGTIHETAGITYELQGAKGKASGFKLFSHVITHEYHHKGQVLSLSRQLGYTPVDTDIMR